jgi:hypothetical protein
MTDGMPLLLKLLVFPQECAETDAENSDTDTGKATLPKVVGIGLRTVFDIIR